MSTQNQPQPISKLTGSVIDVLSGSVGGIGLTLVGHPFDTLKVRLQTQSTTNPVYSGLGDCVKKTWQTEGPAGFYRGVTSPLFGQVVFNAVQFVSYSWAKEVVSGTSNVDHMTIPQCIAAGGLTGGLVAFVEGPIDLFKTQLQTQVFKPKPLFNSFFGSISYITSNYGLKGATQGLVPTIMRNVPAVASYFGMYEFARRSFCKPGQSVKDLTTGQLLAAGSLGGIFYWIFTYPLDCVKSTMMADSPNPAERKYQSVAHTARSLYAQGGYRRFFVGITPCMLRAAPANAVCFMLYEKSVEILGSKLTPSRAS